jgi:hypothetical protein
MEGRVSFPLLGKRGPLCLTLSPGFGFLHLSFDEADLSDTVWWIGIGGGVLVSPASNFYVFSEGRPYLTIANSLGQPWGVDGRIGLGFYVD